MLLRKNESSLEKKQFYFKDFFSSKLKSSKKKESLQDEDIDTKFSYHKFNLRSYKGLEVLILVAPFVLLTKVILQWFYVRLKVQF